MTRREGTPTVDEGQAVPLLQVTDLGVRLPGSGGGTSLLDGVSLTVEAGHTLGLVGESGSGKSITARSILRLLPRPLEIAGGEVRFGGIDLLRLAESSLRRIRGNDIGIIFQDPHNSFDPAFTIGKQMVETIRAHTDLSRKAARERAIELLNRVGIQRARQRADDYPHQLSGGMAQRAMTAMAISCQPRLLIADEPTTALDGTVQRQILGLLRSLQTEMGMAMLLVSHDLSVISEMADDMVVLYAGRVVEQGGVMPTFAEPHHPYTEALLGARPGATTKGNRLLAIPGNVPAAHEMPSGCRFHPRCRYVVAACSGDEPALAPVNGDAGSLARCLRVDELALRGVAGSVVADAERPPGDAVDQRHDPPRPADRTAPVALLDVRDLRKDYRLRATTTFGRHEVNHAVAGVSFTLAAGEALGIVGESGAGKSTVGRLVLGLDQPTAGTITIDGRSFASTRGRKRRAMRRNIQAVFQNPQAALDPTMTIGDSIAEPLQIHLELTKSAERTRVKELLAQVGLDPKLINRYPHTLSGGQRQRVVIARALALEPSLIICDEPVSALDVSTQAQVVNLLVDLQRQLGMAYLFVGHDLSVVYQVSDRIAVMYAGRIVEIGDADDVYLRPQHPYTRLLLSAVLSLDPTQRRLDDAPPEVVASAAPPAGCAFAGRCPEAMDVCRTAEPPTVPSPTGTQVACHLYADAAQTVAVEVTAPRRSGAPLSAPATVARTTQGEIR